MTLMRLAITPMTVSAKSGALAISARNLGTSILINSADGSDHRCAARHPPIDECHLADDASGSDGFVHYAAVHNSQGAALDDVERIALIAFPKQKIARTQRDVLGCAVELRDLFDIESLHDQTLSAVGVAIHFHLNFYLMVNKVPFNHKIC
jgi:hypothetical protein